MTRTREKIARARELSRVLYIIETRAQVAQVKIERAHHRYLIARKMLYIAFGLAAGTAINAVMRNYDYAFGEGTAVVCIVIYAIYNWRLAVSYLQDAVNEKLTPNSYTPNLRPVDYV